MPKIIYIFFKLSEIKQSFGWIYLSQYASFLAIVVFLLVIYKKQQILYLQDHKMLTQRQKNCQKQNILKCTVEPEPLKPTNVMQKAIEILKKEKIAVQKESEHRQKMHEQDKRKLRAQIQCLKKKIKDLSEQNILNNLIKNNPQPETSQQDKLLERRLHMQINHLKTIITEKDNSIENYRVEMKNMEKNVRKAQEEKEKNMEISLVEKIHLQEKIALLSKEVQSKKSIITGLSKEIERVGQKDYELRIKEKEMVKRGKDIQKYQQEFQGYYQKNQRKMKSNIENLQRQNQFLKKQIKKIMKKVKNSCQCEGEADQWKDKLFKLGRQLAKARVEICKMSTENEEHKKQKKSNLQKDRYGNKIQSSQHQESIQSLSLSEDSDEDSYKKTTVKK